MPYQIVGVVKHLRHTTLFGDEKESLYFQANFGNAMARPHAMATRTTLAASVRAALREVDPQLLITNMQPLTANVDRAMAPTRFALGLISVFASSRSCWQRSVCTACCRVLCVSA